VNAIFERNLAAFLNAHPEYSHLKDFEPSGRIKVEHREGHVVLTENGVPIDSTSRFHSGNTEVDENAQLAIFYGLGLGTQLLDVAKAMGSTPIGYIIIEPSVERFFAALSVRDLSGALSTNGVTWLINKTPDEVYNDIYLMMFDTWLGPRRTMAKTYKNRKVAELNEQYFKSIDIQIKNAANVFYHSFGDQNDCFTGIRYTYKNLDFIKNTPGLIQLKDKFAGMPAVVVATGPSLNKSLPKLKEVQDKCVIIAADASYSILMNAGITPHFVASLERHIDTVKFFDGVKKADKDPTHLVAFPLSPKETLQIFDGPKLAVYRNYSYYYYLENKLPKGMILCGHSVAHMCCKIADMIGCSHIYLIGQDLAYDPDTLQTHASGVSHGSDKKMTEEELKKYCKDTGKGELQKTAGNLKDEVYSNDLWIYFAKEYITEQKQTKSPIINLTEGGLKIPMVPWEDINEVFSKFKKLEISPSSVIKKEIKPEKHELTLDDLYASLEAAVQAAKAVKKQLRKSKGKKPKIQQRAIDEAEKFKTHIASKNKEFLGYVYESDVKLLVGIEQKTYELDKTQLNEKVELWEKWFEEVLRIYEEVVQEIKVATGELSESPQ